MTTDITIISLTDPLYPPLLKQLTDPPSQLYIRGSVKALAEPYLFSVVGSRSSNTYGRQVCERILPTLVKAGIVLVSGLAHGIDSLVHRVCVAHKKPTIAVIGSGLDDDSIYPSSNLKLVHKIIENNGCLISEHPIGQKALRHFFPKRNRIIAGLTKATLLIQAAQKSGSLITARLALEANREVMAIPGSITDPLSYGTNMLIKDGALSVTSPEDILNFFEIELEKTEADLPQLTLEQNHILKHLNAEPQHIDVLIETLQQPAESLSAQLLELELLGYIEHLGGMQYVRR